MQKVQTRMTTKPFSLFYAASQSWTTVHLGQFVGMVIITFGLVALFFAVDVRSGVEVWLNRFALLLAGVALALYGVLQAVDGVGLKQAMNAWASVGNGDKAVRFAVAETVRWLEWAVRSYHSFVFGLAVILFGVVIAVTGGFHARSAISWRSQAFVT